MSELYHVGPSRPYCGEIWACSDCGDEMEILEDHDLPVMCECCGVIFERGEHRCEI